MIKRIICCVFTLLLMILFPQPVSSEHSVSLVSDKLKKGWNTIDESLYYVKADGSFIRKSCKIDGIRYKFDSDGICLGKYTGWTKSAHGRRYYKDGVLIINKWIRTKSGSRYYLDDEGYSATGNVVIKGSIYSFDDNGKYLGEGVIPEDGFGIVITDDSITSESLNMITVKDKNSGLSPVYYGYGYYIEKNINGKWEALEPLYDVAWPEDRLCINSGETVSISIPFGGVYGKLSNGSYRIGKLFSNDTGKRWYFLEFKI